VGCTFHGTKIHPTTTSPGRGARRELLFTPYGAGYGEGVPPYPGMCIPGLVTYNPCGIKERLIKEEERLFLYM